jgi:hypothetical protein
VKAETLDGLDLGASFTDVPGGTAYWTFTGGTNYNDQIGDVAIVINKADASCTVDGWSDTYDATSHGASGTCTGVGGVDLSAGLNLGDTFTNVPGGTAHWTFTGGTNYNDQSGDVAIVINKAYALCSFNSYNITYDGNPHTATGSCKGVIGETLTGLDLSGTTHVNAGNYLTDPWVFTDSTGNYNDANGTLVDIISKADATLNISGYTGMYNGDPHGASGTATGVKSEDLSAGLNLGDTFTNVPGGTAHWTFTGGTNYNDASGSVDIVIEPANADCSSITGWSGTYDGDPHGATGECIGVKGEILHDLDLGASFTDVPGGSADWTFTDVTENYNDDSGSVDIIISKADPACTVTGYSVVYDHIAHTATGSCTGVKDEALSGLNLNGTTHTEPGDYINDPWTFTDVTGNYNNTSGTVHDNIHYQTGGMCYGGPGHSILQPIDADGGSVFKQKSTVPAKFRVCDANGVSIGNPGVVSSFRLIQIISGTSSETVEQDVVSTTPDTVFRWSPDGQQWIFNINTKNLKSGMTYLYRITLNDGSTIEFQFGLK